MTTRLCRHPLRIVTHDPKWLTCDTHEADFLHREDCPGLGTPGCAEQCMQHADPVTAALDALFAQPPAVPERRRHVRTCAHCREPITGLWVGPIPAPGTHAGPRFHFDREPCAAASGAYGPGERL